MRVDVESFHVLPVHSSTSSGLSVRITVSMECRFPEIGGQRRVGEPSRAQLEILKLGIELLPLVVIQLSLLLL